MDVLFLAWAHYLVFYKKRSLSTGCYELYHQHFGAQIAKPKRSSGFAQGAAGAQIHGPEHITRTPATSYRAGTAPHPRSPRWGENFSPRSRWCPQT